MRVLVCGDRRFDDWSLLCQVLGRFGIDEIIEGGATGADFLARVWAKYLGVPFREFPANWKLYGKAAGPIRNKQMLDEGKPDLAIAFLAPGSRGTKDMIEQARKAGVEVEVIDVEV